MDALVLLQPACPGCGATHGRGLALTSACAARRTGLRVRIAVCRCGSRVVYDRPRSMPPVAVSFRPDGPLGGGQAG